MKTLLQYLENSLNFLNDGPTSQDEEDLKRIRQFIEDEKLEGEFADLLTRDDEWKNLAEKKRVMYFIDRKINDPRVLSCQPKISLCKFVNSSIPVIKFVM